MDRTVLAAALLVAVSVVTCARAADAADACAGLKSLKLPGTVVLEATRHAAGSEEFTVRGPPNVVVLPLKVDLPAHCVVRAALHPTRDSDIRVELWLPESGWNHRYQQVGNGGLAGAIPVSSLIEPLRQGWAVAGTDDGHVGETMADGRWALGHPEKVVDYGHRAVHLTAQRAQAIVQAYYRSAATHRYFVGCSDGGRESLMEAQRYPDDFDGFVAGAPGIDIPGLSAGGVQRSQLAHGLGAAAFSAAQIALVRDRALQACDARDGIADGVVAEPRRCDFRVDTLQCAAQPDGAACLTVPQVAGLRQVLDGLRDPRTGAMVAQGYGDTLGSSVAPAALSAAAAANPLGQQLFGNMVYGRADLDILTLDPLQAARDARAKLAPVMNPERTDLTALRRAGKKIIQYHGWWDGSIPAASSTDYYAAVQKSSGDTQDFYRLFMVPGMNHCGGGVGASWVMGAGVQHDADHDVVEALVRWVEQGVAPEQIIATEFTTDAQDPIIGPLAGTPVKSTRPVCAWPTVARRRGAGATTDAANFRCEAP